MRKVTVIAILLMMFMVPLFQVSAQAPSSFKSTVNLTNTSAEDGTIQLTFYNSDGSIAAQIDDVITGYETKWITTFDGLASGFDGSLVVSSSVSLASMSILKGENSTGNTLNYASFIASSEGSNTVFLPLLMSKNYGYSSYFYVQNTSDSPVDVDIAYSDGTTNNTIRDLAPSASVKIDNGIDEVHPELSFTGELNATGPIAVAVVEYSDGRLGDQLYAYSGFPSGSTNPIFPMINENNYGYWTSANIQNIGTEETTVTITYTPTASGSTCSETQTIPPGEKRDFATYAFVYDPSLYPYSVTTDCNRNDQFVGGGVVTENTANQPLVGIDNQINNTNDPNKGAALMSLNPDTASDTVVFPYVRQWDGSQQWWSSWTVINVSGESIAAGEIECRVVGSDLSGAVDTVISNPNSLADGEGWLKQFYNGFPPLSNGFVGGAVCKTTSGRSIVGQANILAANAGIAIDSLAVFEGINP